MRYKIIDFCKKDKNIRKKYFKAFLNSQGLDFLVSCSFILLSSSKHIFSLTNGAIWVFLWYTLSMLLSLCMLINQSEYNDGIKRAARFSKKHLRDTVEKGHKFSAEIGGWNLISAQFMCAMVGCFALAMFSLICQSNCLSNYMVKYKDFCIGVFTDTYILVFFSIYYKGIILEVKLISTWKKKFGFFLHTFDGSIIRNLFIHIFALAIIVCALIYYFSREFSGLFNPILRRIMGLIYILYMIDVKTLRKKINSNL